MANRITDLFNDDPTAGDVANIVGDELLVFDPSPSSNQIKSKAMTINQLKVIASDPARVGELQFGAATATLKETSIDVSVPVTINRLNGSAQAISVDWTLAGTAIENTHYTIYPTAGTLVFAEFETTKSLYLTLLSGTLSSDKTVEVAFTAGTFKKEGASPPNQGVPEVIDNNIEGVLSSTTIDLQVLVAPNPLPSVTLIQVMSGDPDKVIITFDQNVTVDDTFAGLELEALGVNVPTLNITHIAPSSVVTMQANRALTSADLIRVIYTPGTIKSTVSGLYATAFNIASTWMKPPVWDIIPPMFYSLGEAVSLDLNDYISDNGGDTVLIFSIIAGTLPSYLELDAGGLITGNVTIAGSYLGVQFSALNSTGNTSSNLVDFTVAP